MTNVRVKLARKYMFGSRLLAGFIIAATIILNSTGARALTIDRSEMEFLVSTIEIQLTEQEERRLFLGGNRPTIYQSPTVKGAMEIIVRRFQAMMKINAGIFEPKIVTTDIEGIFSEVFFLIARTSDYEEVVRKFAGTGAKAAKNGCHIKTIQTEDGSRRFVAGVANHDQLGGTGTLECAHLTMMYHLGLRIAPDGRNIATLAGKRIPSLYYRGAAILSRIGASGEMTLDEFKKRLRPYLR